jgi:ribosome-binding protein aMBF1 (putative translation factor)
MPHGQNDILNWDIVNLTAILCQAHGPPRPVIIRIRKSEYLAFARLLREARERSGLTQRDVAKQLGVPQSFVSKYESGERRLDLLEVRRICSVLNTDLVDIAGKVESLHRGAE